jgi:asparagine synthase (glutamine-hydrolysing)
MGLGEKLAKAVSVANAGVGLLDTFLIAGEVFSPTEIDRLFGGGCELGRIDESFSLGDWEIKTPIEQILAVDFRTYLADDILCKLDRATMAVGLEGRGPLLDHKIIEFAASLPYNYKTQNGVSKRILRDVLYRHIPRNLIDRPKMGFGVPVESWMREVPSLRERLEWYLSKELLQRSGFQDVKYIENLLYGYLNNGFYFKKIWQIYSYQAWFDRWAK